MHLVIHTDMLYPLELIGLSHKGMSSVMFEQKLCGKSWLKICSSRWDCSPTPPPPPRIRSGSWAAVSAVQLCSDYSLTPLPPEWEVEAGLQWVQFNFAVTAVWPAPRMRSGSWAAVSAVQLCSDCSVTTPPEWEVEVGLQWVQFNFAVTAVWPPPGMRSGQLGCSECSSTLQWLQSDPPPQEWEVEVGLQWVQFNFAVTAVWPPPEWEVEVGLQWVQFNFAVAVVWPPLPNLPNWPWPMTEESSLINYLHAIGGLLGQQIITCLSTMKTYLNFRNSFPTRKCQIQLWPMKKFK